ncbi:hypothetical protein M5033_11115, partial [Neisseria meningitidis]|nr:hypothetical protein [Neisseria meningitidis]
MGGLLEEGAHEKSPKCLGGNLGDFGGFCKGLNLIHKWAETDSNWGKKSPMRLSTDWTQTANEGIALTPSQVAQ